MQARTELEIDTLAVRLLARSVPKDKVAADTTTGAILAMVTYLLDCSPHLFHVSNYLYNPAEPSLNRYLGINKLAIGLVALKSKGKLAKATWAEYVASLANFQPTLVDVMLGVGNKKAEKLYDTYLDHFIPLAGEGLCGCLVGAWSPNEAVPGFAKLLQVMDTDWLNLCTAFLQKNAQELRNALEAPHIQELLPKTQPTKPKTKTHGKSRTRQPV